MTQNILYASGGEYNSPVPAGQISPLVQGQQGQQIPITIRDLAGGAVDLTGAGVTGHKRDAFGNVTLLTGGLALGDEPGQGQIWASTAMS